MGCCDSTAACAAAVSPGIPTPSIVPCFFFAAPGPDAVCTEPGPAPSGGGGGGFEGAARVGVATVWGVEAGACATAPATCPPIAIMVPLKRPLGLAAAAGASTSPQALHWVAD